MYRGIGIAMLFGLLASCTPLSLFYREGTPVAQMTRDEAICRNEALRVVPVTLQTRIIPGTRAPRTLCNAAGQCHTYWVQISPNRIETYDANEGARHSYLQNCMIAKGYARVRLPACPS